MIMKVLVVSLILSFITFFELASTCLAETLGNIEQSKQQIFALIQSGDYAGADTATNKLIANFANTPGTDEAVHQIALKHQEVKNYQKSIELSRQVIASWPQSPHAAWSQMDIVIANLSIGNNTAVLTEVETLVNRYKDNPNLPRMLYIVGQGYKSDDFSQILKQHFNSNSPAKIRLAISNADITAKIESGDYGTAAQKVDKMIIEFSSEDDLPDILLAIAQQFSWQHQPECAGSVYRQIVQRFPDSPIAAKAQKSISKTGQITNIVSKYIEASDYGRVNIAIQELINKFGDEVDTAAAVYEIANRLECFGQFVLARQAYEQIIWRYPKEAWADMSRMGVQRTKVLAFVEIGDDTSAKSTFDSVLNDFKGNSYLPSHVMWTAEGYYRMACKVKEKGDSVLDRKLFDKTMATDDVVLTQFPASTEVPNALYLTAECRYQLNEYQAAADLFKRVSDDYPKFQLASNALYMTAQSYQVLKKFGAISELQADAKTKSAYEQLLQKYPNCASATSAQSWLDKNGSKYRR